MKYLLLFLISFNVMAISHERIDELAIGDRIHKLLNRLDKECLWLDGEYQCTGGNPTALALENELTLLKAELHVKEDARIAEQARLSDLRIRFKAIKHSKHLILKVSNPAAWWRDNKHSMNRAQMEAKMQAMEAQEILEVEKHRLIKESDDIVKQAGLDMKSANCDALSGTIKNMCIILKGK